MSAEHVVTIASDARLRILAEVSHTLAASTTDYAALLEAIATTCARLVGDGCLVTLVDPARDELVGVANAHRELDLADTYRSYVSGVTGISVHGDTLSAQVVRTGVPAFVPVVDPEALAARSPPALSALVERLAVSGFIIVAIRARGTIIGTLSMMRTGPGHPYADADVLLLQDLADRAGLAIDNARLYQELEARVQQRTKELEAFSFVVAHSIRAPLRTISAFSEALYEDANHRLEAHSQDDLARIRGAVSRVRETVDSLLHLAKLSGTELRITEVDLTVLVSSLIAQLQATEPRRRVVVDIAPGLSIRADAKLVELALTNLLSNAWQSTRSRSDATIGVTIEQRQGVPAVVVQDNGNLTIQHARALLARESSSQTRPSGDFGVGIVIARQVIERHGGRLEIEPRDAAGTSVWFTLST